MADLQDFYEEEARRKTIQDAIFKLQTMTPNEHHQQDQKIVALFSQITGLAINLMLDKAEGKDQDIEEQKKFVKLEAALIDIQNYLTISKNARMNRMVSEANKYYYHVKQLAKDGNKEAEAIYLDLKKSKEEQLKNELGESDN